MSVRLSVCGVPRHNSRTERPKKPRIGRMEAHHTSIQWTYLEVKRSKVKVTRPIIFRTERPTNFKLGIQTEHEDPHQRQAPWSSRSQCVWQVLAYKSRTKRPRKIVYPTSNNASKTQGQRSRSPGRLMLIPAVRHIRNRKAYELQTWYTDAALRVEDPRQRQAQCRPRSKVKVARSRDASDRCWPISRERNVIETPKLVGNCGSRCRSFHTVAGVRADLQSPMANVL